MSVEDIVFNPDQKDHFTNSNKQRRSEGLALWLVRHSGGLVKNEFVANSILVAVAVFFFFLSFIILVATF